MEVIDCYKDVVRKIDILERELEIIEVEMTFWFGKLAFGGRGSAKFGMLAAMDNTQDIYNKKYDVLKLLEFYKEMEEEMRLSIEGLEGVQYKIARLRVLEGMTYQEIADELGLTHGYVRQVSSKTNKKRTDILKNA
ncbi:sigma factor-like helix-turn-helix DNA-binding protein [Psychrobacillus sp. FSL K6-2365]|uniref:sigma factor-like helix-turn-helix DNA-binding protein n=1 Tax=Psychrobacillus sp. FSL K6-2365 TaxID=2921546 RepID=UPI0030FA7164